MEDLCAKVAAHDATLTQMHERIGRIETRVTAIEARLSRVVNGMLYVGGALAILMTIYTVL